MVLAIYLLNLNEQPGELVTHIYATPRATQAGKPMLQQLALITDQAYGSGDQYVPNSWGAQKERIVRTANGDLFMTYISAGEGLTDREWHLMHKAPRSADWQEIRTGNAGVEPINIVLGKNDSIHLFAWPGTQGKLQHIYSSDNGKTFISEWLPGNWQTGQEQGYSSVGVNDNGDMAFIQTGEDKPGVFNWTYYNSQANLWTFHTNKLDLRYTYAFLFPGYNGDLSIVATRDVQRHILGLPQASQGNPWIFNEIKYFHFDDVTAKNPLPSQLVIKTVQPKDTSDTSDRDVLYVTDSYVDTANRLHILYLNEYDGPHQAILENGKLVKDVAMHGVNFGQKMRIIQDTQGHFYIIAMGEQGNTINIYPGAANDTDGTRLGPEIKLDISRFPGCTDYDFCHSPTFTIPRAGNELSDTIDGVYGNFNKEVYFRINLRGGTNTAPPTTKITSPHIALLPYIDDKQHLR
ncbi:hypothetical protein KDI_45450 [Dictyobacter arantiisoli]|uniref:Sialidase domain-containing protein n=2 Tax=Dictyobacter arantiisoli TaxID=2014874 RepID=A0A5A5THD1_9CHLR|nr:hypothetical protein KDI_45450 [Dictyobacter arantiisoli]